MKKYLAAALSTSALVGLATSPALAQDDAEDAEARMTTVTVTTQKRAESLNDVPIAISAVGEQTLEATGISNVTELIPYVPGLTGSATGVATNVWNIRGIGTNDWSVGSEPAVAVFLDDAYIGRNVNAAASFFDVERIEVVKGPQGTLFGRNASAGAINIISKKPEDSNSLQVGAGIGNENQSEVMLIGNTALSDQFRVRLAYRNEGIEGIQFAEGIDQDIGTDTNTLRLTGALDFSDATTALASFHYSDFKSTSGRLHNPSLSELLALPGAGDPFADTTSANDITFEDGEVFGANLRVTHDFNDAITLTSITDWRSWEYEFAQDLDGIGFNLPVDLGDAFFGAPGSIVTFGSPRFFQPDVGADTISQELRLNGTSDNVDWFIGASYFNEDVNENAFLTWPMAFDATALLGGGGVVNIYEPSSPAGYAVTGENTSIGVYGDVTFALSDRIDLTGGVRWTQDEKDYCSSNIDPSFGFLVVLGPDTLGETICGSNDSDDVTYRIVGDFKATDDLLLYASFATGYKGGGFNTAVNGSGPFGVDAPFSLAAFDPETSESIEIGAKATLFGGDVQLNSAIYMTDYSDLQLLDTALSLRIDNVASVESNGAEFDLTWAPSSISGLTVAANYAYNDAEISAPGQAIDGSVLPIAPEQTFAATVLYDHDLGSKGTLSWFGGYTWQDDIIFDVNGSRVPQEAYGKADASLTFRPTSGNYDVSLSANNIFDEEYIVSGADPLGLGFPLTQRGAPQLYMLRLNVYLGDK